MFLPWYRTWKLKIALIQGNCHVRGNPVCRVVGCLVTSILLASRPSTPKLAALQRRHYWKKIMWLSDTLPCLARYAFWLCHENAMKKAKFCFFTKNWISTFSHVSIFVLPCNCHAKLLSHVFAMAVFWTLKIALQQGKSHVCGNPVPAASRPMVPFHWGRDIRYC